MTDRSERTPVYRFGELVAPAPGERKRMTMEPTLSDLVEKFRTRAYEEEGRVISSRIQGDVSGDERAHQHASYRSDWAALADLVAAAKDTDPEPSREVWLVAAARRLAAHLEAVHV